MQTGGATALQRGSALLGGAHHGQLVLHFLGDGFRSSRHVPGGQCSGGLGHLLAESRFHEEVAIEGVAGISGHLPSQRRPHRVFIAPGGHSHVARDVDLRRVPARLLRAVFHVLHRLPDEALGGPVHQHAVGHFPGQLQHLRSQCRDVDGHPLLGRGAAQRGRRDVEVPSLMGHVLSRQQSPHDADGLPQPGNRTPEGNPVAPLDRGPVPYPQAEDEAVARNGGHACGAHGGIRSGSGVDGQDAGAQPHPFRLHGDGGQGRQRVASGALGNPDGLVAQVFSQLPQLLEVLRGKRGIILETHSVSGHGLPSLQPGISSCCRYVSIAVMSCEFETIDFRGVTVICSHRKWDRHISNHREMEGQQSAVITTLKEPHRAERSSEFQDRLLYYRRFALPSPREREYLLVVVAYPVGMSETGIVLTAYSRWRIQEGNTRIW